MMTTKLDKKSSSSFLTLAVIERGHLKEQQLGSFQIYEYLSVEFMLHVSSEICDTGETITFTYLWGACLAF
jgi:hypothetical protein